MTGTYATSLIVILIVQMAVIVAPIVARDETETVITKTANKTITVSSLKLINGVFHDIFGHRILTYHFAKTLNNLLVINNKGL